jgi:hypothetical protein
MKILNLLKDETRCVWVQGQHTRLLLSGELFEVLSQVNSKGAYVRKNYEGYIEEEAVAAFIKSEMKGV